MSKFSRFNYLKSLIMSKNPNTYQLKKIDRSNIAKKLTCLRLNHKPGLEIGDSNKKVMARKNKNSGEKMNNSRNKLQVLTMFVEFFLPFFLHFFATKFKLFPT